MNEAIERTRPTGPGQRHRLIFVFARELKGIPGLADAGVADLKPHVRRWHKRALPYINTKPWEETWFDFANGWQKVKFAKGEGTMDIAFAKALQAEVPKIAEDYDQAELRILVLLCRELQRGCGDAPFFLATRVAGRLLNIHYTTISVWLNGLQTDGILKLVARGNIKERKASRFRYIAGDL